MIDSSQSTSTRPYLLRALYEWCADNALTPYVAAHVDDTVNVPREYVKNNEIVLNISMDATSNLKIENDYLRFKARFGGVAREIVVPITHIIAIYARENGQGMAFPAPQVSAPIDAQSKAVVEKRQSALRSVSDSSAAPADIVKTGAAAEPAKIVKLKPAEDDPRPPPGPAGGPSRKSPSKPSLTRVK